METLPFSVELLVVVLVPVTVVAGAACLVSGLAGALRATLRAWRGVDPAAGGWAWRLAGGALVLCVGVSAGSALVAALVPSVS